MRFLAAFGLAAMIVLGMLLIGLKLSGFMEQDDARTLNLHDVDVLSETQRRDLADALGNGEGRAPPRFPLLTDIPPLEVHDDGEETDPEAERAAR